jgi:hypothetical protein
MKKKEKLNVVNLGMNKLKLLANLMKWVKPLKPLYEELCLIPQFDLA